MPEHVAIFAVQQAGKTLSIDPVTIVRYGPDQRYKRIPSFNSPLPSRNWTEADFDKFEHAYYKPGTSVSVFLGGERIGTATVQSSNAEGKDGGCVVLSAAISYDGTAQPLLATSTTFEIPGHNSTRRDATPAESLLLQQLAIGWLRDYGLDRQLLRRGRIGQVTSTVLRENAGHALVARFDVRSKHAIHQFFAIAEEVRGTYQLTLTNLEIQRDLEDGTDQTEREYIDQLDTNNDGLDEVITSTSHYESWRYDIWSFDTHTKVWGHTHRGGGGGC